MEDKKQDVKSLEELLKAADEFRKQAVDFGNKLSKVLADIKVPKKEEDTWEMKCPYKYDDEYWLLFDDGDTDNSFWGDSLEDEKRFNVGNVFPTECKGGSLNGITFNTDSYKCFIDSNVDSCYKKSERKLRFIFVLLLTE